MIEGRFSPVVSPVVFDEYQAVVRRETFDYPTVAIENLLQTLVTQGLWLNPPVSDMPLQNPADPPFMDLARFAACAVVTGNARHFPVAATVEVLGPGTCVERLLKA